MSKQTIERTPAGRKAKPTKSDKRTGGKNVVGRTANGRCGAKTRRAQLVALLSRKDGARLSLIMQRLGWQAHTVRAAISGLRKQGFAITTSKARPSKAKTFCRKTSSGGGETVYAIDAHPESRHTSPAGASQ